jgi:hypothetical protein
MVCYARPASRLAAILVVALLVFGRPASHYLDTAAVAVAVAVATGGTAVAAALVLAAFMSTRRRRAAAGGCVSCRFRCQHAMTEPSRRMWLVTTADRRAPAPVPVPVPVPGRLVPGRPEPVFLPVPSVGSAPPADVRRAAAIAVTCGKMAPRWPDRPARGAAASPPRARERAGSPA